MYYTYQWTYGMPAGWLRYFEELLTNASHLWTDSAIEANTANLGSVEFKGDNVMLVEDLFSTLPAILCILDDANEDMLVNDWSLLLEVFDLILIEDSMIVIYYTPSV